MATYYFRLGGFGYIQDPSTWFNQTANAIATAAPGVGDTIILNAPNGNLLGDGIVDQLITAAPTGATPFTISGTISIRQLSQTSALALASGAVLNLLGRATPSPATIAAPTSVTGATLAVTGPLAVTTGSLSASLNSTISASNLTLGVGATATLSLNNSSLTLHGGTGPALVAATANAGSTTPGTAHIALANNAILSTDNAIILGDTGAADLTAATGATITTTALTLGITGTATATITGSTLNVGQRITVGNAGTATLNLASSTVTAQDLVIAAAATAHGNLSLSAGAALQLQSTFLLGPAGSAAAQLNGSGTLLTSPTAAIIAQSGTATLTLSAGAQARFAGLYAATATGGTAAINLDGTNTRLTLSGPTLLGQAGPTTITLSNAALVTAQDITLGNSAIAIASGASLSANQITGSSLSSLSLSSNGTLTAATLSLTGALTLATNSTVTVTNATLAGLTLTTGATLNAANLALAAPLTISAGASLNATTLSSTASILVTGPGSHLTLANPPAAQITLTQGAILSLPTLSLGGTVPILDSTSLITIGTTPTLTGTGFNVAATATLTLAGTVIGARVTNAGIVSATNATLAAAAGSGTYQVAGGTLDIGSFNGTATFTNQFAVLRLRSLSGPATITNIRAGDTIDLPGQVGTLAGNVLTDGSYSLTLTPDANTVLRLDNLPTGTRLTAVDPLFDPTYYLAHNPDVAAAGVDPYRHFTMSGWAEGRDPSALFNLNYYRATYVDSAGQNPLTQFEQSGWQAGRNPDAFFSTGAYLAQNPDVAAAAVNPLRHYQSIGWKEGRNPSPLFSISDYHAAYGPTTTDPLAIFLGTGRAAGQTAIAAGPAPEPGFDPAYYYAHNPDVRAAGVNAMQHWLYNGAAEGRAPNAIFDPNYYQTQYPDAGPDPLASYLATGAAQGRDPSLLFSTAKYLLQNPDVASAHINPMLHYLANGQFEGRMAFLSGPTAPADPLVQTQFYDRQLGATFIPGGLAANQQAAASYDATGWQHGLNPDPLFNTAYYLAHNPDVAAAHINPLLHYENNGWKEGRNPSAGFNTRAYLAANPDVSAAAINPLSHYLQNGQSEGRQAYPAPA